MSSKEDEKLHPSENEQQGGQMSLVIELQTGVHDEDRGEDDDEILHDVLSRGNVAFERYEDLYELQTQEKYQANSDENLQDGGVHV